MVVCGRQKQRKIRRERGSKLGSLFVLLDANSLFIFTLAFISWAIFLGNENLAKWIGRLCDSVGPAWFLSLRVQWRSLNWASVAWSDIFLAPAENNSSVHLIKKISSPGNGRVPVLEQSGMEYVSNWITTVVIVIKREREEKNVSLVSFSGVFNLGWL